jgi:guanylate kinase
MSKIYIVMGKSATGKDTIFKNLKNNPDLNLKSVIGYTTRPIRDGETNGVEYYFVTEKDLARLKEAGKVIEHRAYQTMHGVWNYFTVDDGQIDLTRYDYIMIGTLESYEQIRDYYGKNAVVPIYIQVEDGLRLERALRRERSQEFPKYSEMCRRYLADEEDFSEENLRRLNITKRYDNNDLTVCLNEIISDIKQLQSKEKNKI